MKKNRWLITLFVIILGIAVVGIANASTIKNASLFSDQTAATPSGTSSGEVNITPGVHDLKPEERAGLFLEACRQLNNASIDSLLQKAGIARQDIQEAEKLWAQEMLGQNPNLSIQQMAPMHMAWAMGYIQQYRPQVTVNTVNTAAAALQDNPAPTQPPAPVPSQQSYQSTPAGHGYHPGHTGQYCTQWPGTGGTPSGHHGGGHGMGGHE